MTSHSIQPSDSLGWIVEWLQPLDLVPRRLATNTIRPATRCLHGRDRPATRCVVFASPKEPARSWNSVGEAFQHYLALVELLSAHWNTSPLRQADRTVGRIAV